MLNNIVILIVKRVILSFRTLLPARVYVRVYRQAWVRLPPGSHEVVPQEFAHLSMWILNVAAHPGPLRRCRLCIIDDLHLQRCAIQVNVIIAFIFYVLVERSFVFE